MIMSDKKTSKKQKQARTSLGDLLSYAAYLCDHQRLKSLVDRASKKLPRLVDSSGRTALHVAVSLAVSGEMTEWMLKECNMEIDKTDSESMWTALHRSVYYGNVAAAIQLIKHGANVYQEDREGLTPLDLLDCNRQWTKRLPERDIRYGSEVLTWGFNNNVTLGHADEASRTYPERVCAFMLPTPADIIEVLLCKFHSVFLAADGRVFTCGHGHGGRLGHGDEQSHVVPKLIQSLQNVKCVCIAAARDHTVFLSDGGEVSTCGLNDCCQLGYGGVQGSSCNQSLSPRRVKYFKGQRVTHIAAGRYHTAVCTGNELYTWGRNVGQLGYSQTDILQCTPKQVTHLKGFKILLLCASDSATACCTSNGDIFVLIDHTCRKIAVSPFRPSELPLSLCISASLGYLVNERDNDVGMVVLLALTKYGEVWKWSPGLRAMSCCRWLNKNGYIRSIKVADVKVGREVYVVSVEGQVYRGSFVQSEISDERVSLTSLSSVSGSNKVTLHRKKPLEWHAWKCDEVDREAKCVVMLERLPELHRVVKVFCDFKGQNRAVLRNDPILSLSQFPQISQSSFAAEMQLLLNEADPGNSVHDVLVKVGESHDLLPLHRVVLASQSSYFRDLLALNEPAVIEVNNIEPNVFSHLLSFLYTGKVEVVSNAVDITNSSGSKKCEVFSLSEDGHTDDYDELLEEDLTGCLFSSSDISNLLDEDAFSSEDETDSACRSHSESILISNSTQLTNQRFGSVEGGKDLQETQTLLSPNSTSAFAVYQTITQKEEQAVRSPRKRTQSHEDRDVLPLMAEKLYRASVRFRVTGLSRRLQEMYPKELGHAQSLNLQSASAEVLEQRSCSHLYDVTLIAEDGISVGCHKCILVARSEYFRSMLTMGWKETVCGPVSLYVYFPSNVLQVVVDFIYSDEAVSVKGCNDLNFIGSVLIAADQMLMMRLKEMCEEAIARLMTIRTVVEILQFSDLYGASQLKTAALMFISCNLADLLEGGHLNDLSRSLADDITTFYRNLIPCVGGRVIRMSAVSLDAVDSVGNIGCLSDKERANRRKSPKIQDLSIDVKGSLRNEVMSSQLGDVQATTKVPSESGSLLYQSLIESEVEEEKNVKKSQPFEQESLPELAGQTSLWTQQHSFQVTAKSLAEIMAEEEESGRRLRLRKSDQGIGRQPSIKQNPHLILQEKGNTAIRWSVGTLGKSQKQRHKLNSDRGSSDQSPSPTSRKPAWQQTAHPVVSFRHLLAEQLESSEENQEKDNTALLQGQPTHKGREVASPPRGWCIPSSPTESLVTIVRLQEQKTLESQRPLNKPLAIIQIEDRAIEELLDYYGGPFHPEESIKVTRVTDTSRTPIWKGDL